MNFDEMPWLVTIPAATYGPLGKDAATQLRDRLRNRGEQAQAWAAQLPDQRRLTNPNEAR
jgi:hypothetical protein